MNKKRSKAQPDDASNNGANDADCIVQFAVFGEVVLG